MSLLIWETTSRDRDVVGDIVEGSARYCSPPSGCGSTTFAEPDSPRPWAQLRCRFALRNCTHPHPSGFGRRVTARAKAWAPVAPPQDDGACHSSFPEPAAGKTSLAPCPPCAGGSRPRLRSVPSLASPDGGRFRLVPPPTPPPGGSRIRKLRYAEPGFSVITHAGRELVTLGFTYGF